MTAPKSKAKASWLPPGGWLQHRTFCCFTLPEGHWLLTFDLKYWTHLRPLAPASSCLTPISTQSGNQHSVWISDSPVSASGVKMAQAERLSDCWIDTIVCSLYTILYCCLGIYSIIPAFLKDCIKSCETLWVPCFPTGRDICAHHFRACGSSILKSMHMRLPRN